MSADIERSFLAELASRGLLEADRRTYERILLELREFLAPRKPAEYQRRDLEQFLKHRAPTLAIEELQSYGLAMGVLSERLASVGPRGGSPSVPGSERSSIEEAPDLQLKTSSTLNFESMAFGETLHPMRRSLSTPDELPSDGDDDFLAENVAAWANRRETGDSEFRRVSTEPRFVRVKSSPRASGLRIQWNAERRLMELEWRGFVMGEGMRADLRKGSEEQRRRAASAWLGDFSEAGVVSQDDTDWFIGWLQALAELGVTRFAIVSPVHAIARMKLYRLRDLSDASQLSIWGSQMLDLRFFDTRAQAFAWLRP